MNVDARLDAGPYRTDMELLKMPVLAEHDIFVMRQRGREVAAGLGLEEQDQVRVATALSEIGRQILLNTGGALVTFRYEGADVPSLVIEARAVNEGTGDAAALAGAVAVAGRLVDELVVGPAPQPVEVRVRRRLPASAAGLTGQRLERLRQELAASAPTSAIEELSVQNRHLLEAFDQTRRQRDELLRLNAELEETNRGVMALYGQLSQELEETNRGVVALYAELDQRSAQLRDANEAKTRFLASVTHELRAPVAAIIGLTRLLVDAGSHPLTGEQAEQVELIGSSAAELLELVNGLLDLAKVESGRLEPNWDMVSLREVFGQLRGTLRGLDSRPQVRLVVDDPAGAPEVVTDPVLLTQVLRNLVANGLKFTPSGEVRLSAHPPADRPDQVEIAVADTGIGIPADQLERIFEEFYQVPGVRPAELAGAGTQAGGSRGTGLGLPYARKLVWLLGGDLVVTSRPGRGSTFVVRLPRDGGQRPPGTPGTPGMTGMPGPDEPDGPAGPDGAG